MNEMVNKLLLAGIYLCLKFFSDSLDLHMVLLDHLQKAKKEYKNLKKQEIHDVVIKTN